MRANLSNRAAPSVRRGHPWVYREQLERADFSDGDEVELVSEGEVIGRGLGCEGGPIAVRVWTHGESPFGRSLVRKRVERAVDLRTRWFTEETDAFRVVHGEGDRMPGLVIDKYGSVAVVTLDDAGLRARWSEDVLPELPAPLARLGVSTILLKTGRRGETKEIERVHGEPCEMKRTVHEHGVPFVVDIAHGQKTGAFLDQRENRKLVGDLARGRRVLNLFSYAGGFSLWAARGGATHVTSVDVASQAHATAQESFKRAGLSTSAHEFVTQDCFAFLERAASKNQTWDLVISDPPSFAPNAKSVPGAIAAYKKLHAACAKVLGRDAVFCASSCSSHVTSEMFASTLDDTVVSGESLRIVATHGAPCDHPTLPAFPEGRYLKFVVME